MTSRNISDLALLAALVIAAAGCGGGHDAAPRPDVTSVRPDTTVTRPNSPPGDSLPGPDLPTGSEKAAAGQTGSIPDGGGTSADSTRLVEPVPRSANLIMGYRVQIFTSASLVDAEQLRDRLRRQGVPAYVEYRSPLYRVRLWDCTDLAEARSLREKAVLMGFDRATVVPTLVQAGLNSRNAARVF